MRPDMPAGPSWRKCSESNGPAGADPLVKDVPLWPTSARALNAAMRANASAKNLKCFISTPMLKTRPQIIGQPRFILASPCIHHEVTMRSIAFAAALTACILLSCAGPLSAADAPVGCQLVTQAEIDAAFGGTVGAGTPIGLPTSCQWVGQQGKRATLTINRLLTGKSPEDQFNGGKARSVPRGAVEPVRGVGDRASYLV